MSSDPVHLPVDDHDVPALVARLHRATGQLNAVARMLQEGQGCSDVIPQFVAARRALDKVGFQVVASALRTCIADPASTPQDRQHLERLFLTLS